MNSLQVTFKRDISNRTTDLAEIFMNILVTHKIPFYFTENTERQSIKKINSSRRQAYSPGVRPSIRSFIPFANSFHCPNVMNLSVVIPPYTRTMF